MTKESLVENYSGKPEELREVVNQAFSAVLYTEQFRIRELEVFKTFTPISETFRVIDNLTDEQVEQALLDDRTSMLFTEIMDDDWLLDVEDQNKREEYAKSAPADMGGIREWWQTKRSMDDGHMTITDKRDYLLEFRCLIEYTKRQDQSLSLIKMQMEVQD